MDGESKNIYIYNVLVTRPVFARVTELIIEDRPLPLLEFYRTLKRNSAIVYYLLMTLLVHATHVSKFSGRHDFSDFFNIHRYFLAS